jgi:hypothetical protein
VNKAIWILWPSFVVAGVAEIVFFTLIDPADLRIFGEPAGVSRTAVYTAGFFLFWIFAAASSAFTCFLQRSPVEINRLCPLEGFERPVGCPKREA